MELEVEVDLAGYIGNLSFDTTETDAIFLLLAHLPGFMKEDIEVQVDEAKMEITVSGGGQIKSLEFVNVDRLVNIDRMVEMGRFCDVFSIPDGVVFERIDAMFDDDEEILLILMPKSGREEEEVSCDVDKEVFLEEPIPIPSADQLEEQGNESDEEEIPSEEKPDQDHSLPVNAAEIERYAPQDDRESAVEEQETPDMKDTHNTLAEESDGNYDDRDGNRDVETEDWPPLEKDANSNLVEEQEAPKEFESPEIEDENPTTKNELPPRQTPELIKLPETDTSLSLIEEQEKQKPEIESNLNPTLELENATIEAENPPPNTPELIKLPEIDTNFGTEFNPTQELEEQDPDNNQSTELKGLDRNFNQEDEDSDEEGEEKEVTRERERRRIRKRSSAFPLNATSLLVGSAFLFSLVVLVFHFLRGRKQIRN